MIVTFEAQTSYNYGYDRGTARREGNPVPVSPLGATSSWWIDVGDYDGASGRSRRTFKDGVSYASTNEERLSYEDGYNGNSEPRFTGYDVWFAAGKRHRAQALGRLYYLDVTVAPPVGPAVPGPVRPAPAYTPRPNPGADPMAPPVVVRAPPVGPSPDSFPSPIQRGGGPIPPWQWPMGGGGSGIVLYGPGYYIDFSKLRPIAAY